MTDKLQIKHAPSPMRVIALTGGKGGVGKTTLSVNLAIALAKMKKKVLLFDADLGLANVDVMLGLKPKYTLYDYVSGHCELKDVCIQTKNGIYIVPSVSGISRMADLTMQESFDLIRSFSSLDQDIDVMLIDLASGISSQVMNITHAAHDILVVVCNDPSSIMDSYAVIKILHQQYARSRFGILVNKVKSKEEGQMVFTRFQETASRFININMNYLGYVPQDDFVNFAARERVSVVEQYPQSRATKAIQEVCHRVQSWSQDNTSMPGGVQFFFERLVQTC